MTAEELELLTERAGAFNAERAISGVLLYGGGRFLQLLEGEAQAVKDLYRNRIVPDPRHEDCCVLLDEPCNTRLFPYWSMGWLYMQETRGVAQEAWDAVCTLIAEQNPEAIFSRDPAIGFINEFIELFGDAVDRKMHLLKTPPPPTDTGVLRRAS